MLDTLGWRWGPAHIEVKQTSRGPVLVEVNAGRFNGGRVGGTHPGFGEEHTFTNAHAVGAPSLPHRIKAAAPLALRPAWLERRLC